MSEKEINRVLDANTMLVQELTELKRENKKLKKAILNIHHLVKQTREYMHDGVDIELLDILKEVM